MGNKELKDKIKEIYKSLGITQAEFCRRTEINVSNLSTILSNQDKGVSASMINGIAKIPNINMNWFLKNDGGMFSERSKEMIDLKNKQKLELKEKDIVIETQEKIIKLLTKTN